MGPTRRVLLVASSLALLGALAATSSASAQFYEDARRALGLSSDALDRNPRLVGMGGLSLVGDDIHNHIDLWDFAANPAGLLDADSVSTLEFHPGTRTASSVRDLPEAGMGVRQDLAYRQAVSGFESWRRSSPVTVFGVIGEFGTLRTDRPTDQDLEQRSTFSSPQAAGVISGKLPFFLPERLRYGIRTQYRYESREDRFLSFISNNAGEFVDGDGAEVGPPDNFGPDEHGVRSIAVGAALAYRLGSPLVLAAGFDHWANAIDRKNEGPRYSAQVAEDRPVEIVQVVATGKVGRSLEYAVEGRKWQSSSNQRWAFSLSGGSGARPFAGRGHYLNREEEGRAIRSRARWTLGRLEFGAGFGNTYGRVREIAPPPGDESSFNYFLDRLYNTPGTDLLALPDSVVSDRMVESGWNAGAGVGLRLPLRDALLAMEWHRDQNELNRETAGRGPKQKGWDVRGGLDLRVTPVLRVRGGYSYRREDDDIFTRENESVIQTGSLGLGMRPAGARWGLDVTYALARSRSDFGDPGRSRASAQRLLSRLRWEF